MRYVAMMVVFAIVTLANGAMAESTVPDTIAECAKLGAVWLTKHPVSSGWTVITYYSQKTNKCWIIETNQQYGERTRSLYDAQTGAAALSCNDNPGCPSRDVDSKKDCDYVSEIETGDLASGFMIAK